MKIVISSGHGKYIRGASGSPVPPQLDEVDEARRVVDQVAEFWRSMGVQVTTFHDNTSHDQNTNLNTIVNFHNAQGPHDLDVSVHFNAYDGSAHGHETLYVSGSGQTYAAKVASAVSACGFTNRGAKKRTDLFFLNKTNEVAILIETCFCDNTGDSTTYESRFNSICRAIAESISGVQVPTEPPPVEPPVEEEENRFVMTLQGYGDMEVNINGRHFQVGDRPGECPVIDLTLAVPKHGEDLTIVINGQEFHGPFDSGSARQRDIFATWFGGSSDPNNSAYPPYDFLNDTEYYVALPFNVADAAARERGVRVYANGREFVAKIRDKGPWCTTDDYPAAKARPLAEQCYNDHETLPGSSGPNAGKIPANPAGIDLSPALFRALGMQGNGPVDWEFVK